MENETSHGKVMESEKLTKVLEFYNQSKPVLVFPIVLNVCIFCQREDISGKHQLSKMSPMTNLNRKTVTMNKVMIMDE